MIYLNKIPKFIKAVFPRVIWNIPDGGNDVYLTFDDGPTEEVTPWILDELAKHNAKATFFCLGKNVEANPGHYRRILKEGHAVGNHTYSHLNGWQTNSADYIKDVERCGNIITSRLFRPPYGKLKPAQYSLLKDQYTITMWDLLSGDFDKKLSGDKCLSKIMRNVQDGSIIVFHDSLKAEKNLRYVLPKMLVQCNDLGFTFRNLERIDNS